MTAIRDDVSKEQAAQAAASGYGPGLFGLMVDNDGRILRFTPSNRPPSYYSCCLIDRMMYGDLYADATPRQKWIADYWKDEMIAEDLGLSP